MIANTQEAALMGLTAELSLGQVLGTAATWSATQLSAQFPSLIPKTSLLLAGRAEHLTDLTF